MNPYDFKRQNKNKLPLNLPHYESEEHLNFPRYENIQHFEKHTNSPILPVQQDLCHVQNLQYPQVKFFFIMYLLLYILIMYSYNTFIFATYCHRHVVYYTF